MNTPPSYAPPPPIGRKTWVLVAVLLAFLFAACAGVMVFGAVQVRQIAKTDPKPIAGSGKPQFLGKARGGWGTYRFPEIGLVIDLPDQPKVDPIDWSTEDRLAYEAATDYTVEAEAFGIDMQVAEYRLGVTMTNEDEAEMLRDSFPEVEGVKNVKSEHRPETVGGRKGIFQRITYEMQGEPFVTESYHLNEGRRSITMTFTYVREVRDLARPQIDRIVDSSKFE